MLREAEVISFLFFLIGHAASVNNPPPPPMQTQLLSQVLVSPSVTSSSSIIISPSTDNPYPSVAIPQPSPVISLPQLCPADLDPLWKVVWPPTPAGEIAILPCPGGLFGVISRFCRPNLSWALPDVSKCVGLDVDDIESEANTFFNGEPNADGAIFFINQLVNLTGPAAKNGGPLSKSELSTINSIVGQSLQVLNQEQDGNEVEDIVDLFNNALSPLNKDSWRTLQEAGDAGSEELLSNAESYAVYLGRTLNISGAVSRFSRDNLAIRANRFGFGKDFSNVLFPLESDIVNSSSTDNQSSIKIPSEYLEAFANLENSDVTVVNMLFSTIQDFLPENEDTENITVASVVISSQVFTDNADLDSSSLSAILENNPVEINFTVNSTYNLLDGDMTITCVFWNFTNDFNSTSSGGWVSEGIVSEVIDNSTVRCLSKHLTSFSVLVDVSPSEGTSNTSSPDVEQQVLSVVSYIGVSISIVCLVITITWLLSLGKSLFTEVHNFIHLGLAISLLCGLVLFVAGIQFASSISALCKLVAALLHYFFLSAFCWMLCEGVMLFLLLVIVFSRLTKKWWLYCIIGWGLPVIPVGITLGIGFNNYTLSSDICWLNNSNYLIWGFVGPMLLIISVNVVILVIVLVKIFQSRRHRGAKKLDDITASDKRDTAIALIKGFIVLLPLLGVTWVIGIFAIDSNTTAFAWIFTVLNTLQGAFIFLFHVLTSKKFITKVKSLYLKRKKQRQAISELSYQKSSKVTSNSYVMTSTLN